MMTYLPIALDLRGKRVVLIGGGNVALHKLRTLTNVVCRIVVIAPRILPVIEQMDVEIIRRDYVPEDLDGAGLVYACTNNRQINQRIRVEAKSRGILINVVDDARLSDFISPAVFFAHEGIVTVYSDGKDPVLSRDLKNFIKDTWDEFLSYRHRLQDSAR